MRIRSIKPEFWKSPDVAALSWDARFIWIGLWSYVDDNGVGKDDAVRVRAELFPYEPDVQAVTNRIELCLIELGEKGRISRYEIDAERYLHITNWGRHQKIDRPSKARYPHPYASTREPSPQSPSTASATSSGVLVNTREASSSVIEGSTIIEGSVQTREPSSMEQGAGIREQGVNTPPTPPSATILPRTLAAAFDAFWAAYPRREGKAEAQRKFRIAIETRNADPQVILNKAIAFAKASKGVERQYIAHPATWLHQGRYDDDTPIAPRPPGSRRATDDADVARW